METKLQLVEGLIIILQQAAKDMASNALVIGKVLDKIDKGELWRSYGNYLENFDDFLKDMDIAKSKGHHYMRAYRLYGEYLEERNMFVPIRRLIALAPITTDENKKELIDMAHRLNEAEFQKEIQIKKGINPDTCKHPEEERQYFWQCKSCKRWFKIDNPNN